MIKKKDTNNLKKKPNDLDKDFKQEFSFLHFHFPVKQLMLVQRKKIDR